MGVSRGGKTITCCRQCRLSSSRTSRSTARGDSGRPLAVATARGTSISTSETAQCINVFFPIQTRCRSDHKASCSSLTCVNRKKVYTANRTAQDSGRPSTRWRTAICNGVATVGELGLADLTITTSAFRRLRRTSSGRTVGRGRRTVEREIGRGQGGFWIRRPRRRRRRLPLLTLQALVFRFPLLGHFTRSFAGLILVLSHRFLGSRQC